MGKNAEIIGLAYCELAVGNADHAADALCARYGFTRRRSHGLRRGWTGELSHVLGQGRIELVVTSSLRPRGAAAEFVREHGDGVHDLGLLVDDPEAAFAAALAAGAEAGEGTPAWAPPGSRTIQVFGAYTHTFVTRSPLDGASAEAGEDSSPDDAELLAIDHLALAVPYGELDTWAEFYVSVLGFEIVMKEVTDTGRSSMRSTVVRHRNSGVTFTLVEPSAAEDGGQISEFLTFNGGPGVQHVAFSTRDIVGTVDWLTGRGVEFLSTPAAYYETLAARVPQLRDRVADLRDRGILADRDEGGELLQIFTRPVTGRPTMFFEVIERRGNSSGFGAGNIKALFQAVEAEQARRGTL